MSLARYKKMRRDSDTNLHLSTLKDLLDCRRVRKAYCRLKRKCVSCLAIIQHADLVAVNVHAFVQPAEQSTMKGSHCPGSIYRKNHHIRTASAARPREWTYSTNCVEFFLWNSPITYYEKATAHLLCFFAKSHKIKQTSA
jgi:hypothetical protein